MRNRKYINKTVSGERDDHFAHPLLILVAAIFLMPMPVSAQTLPPIEGLPPDAEYCQIVLTQAGAIRASVNRKKISSRIAGGIPGFANITTTNDEYSLQVDRPTSFVSAPSRGNDDVNFRAVFRGNGATNFGRTRHNRLVSVNEGTTRVKTHFIAKKRTGVFPAGTYNAALTLRCE